MNADGGATGRDASRDEMPWASSIDELAQRRNHAAEPGGHDAVEFQHARGRQTIRERIDSLLDPESFNEVGALTGRGEYKDQTLEHVTRPRM